MAERVEIRGGELDGSVLDNAATEATLLRLVEAFEKKNGAGSGSRLQDAHSRSLRNSTNQSNSLGKSFESTAKNSDSLGESFEKTRSAASKLASGFMGIVSTGIGTIISGATFAVSAFTDFLTSSFASYRDISNVGATFGNDMIEVSRTALNAGMSMSDFADMVKQNSDVLTALGGSASGGAQRLAELRDGIINSDLANRFYGLGLTTKDIETYMGGYLSQVQRLGSLQRRDNMMLTRGVAAYIEELDKVTKLTGIERKRLDEEARKLALDPVFNALRQGLNPEQLAKSSANLASATEIGGQELQDAMKEIATGVIQSPLARTLATSGKITQETARAVARGTLDIMPVLQNAYKNINSLGAYSKAELIAINDDIRSGAKFKDDMRRFQDADMKAAREEQAQRNKLTEAFGKIPAVFDNIRNKIFGAIISSNVFDRMLKTLEKAAVKFEEYLTPLVNYFGKLFEDLSSVAMSDDQRGGIMAAIKMGMKRLMEDFNAVVVPEFKKIIKELFGIEDIGQSIRNLVYDGFTSLVKSAIEGVGSVISSMLGFGTAATPTETRTGTGARENSSEAATNTSTVSSALGNLIPSFERISSLLGYGALGAVGLIAALTAFGIAAKVAAPGVLALGAAVGMGGLGLGAAFYGLSLLTDSVGTFLDKVENFVENIIKHDPNKIKDVGTSLGPLSASLAKMAAGGILALFGSGGLINLGIALEKIQSLDAGKISSINQPLEELQRVLSLYTGTGFFDGLSKIFNSLFVGDAGLSGLADSAAKFSSVDAGKISAIVGPLEEVHRVLSLYTGSGFIDGLGTFFSNLFVGDAGLGGFAKSAAEFNSVDADNIKNIASGMESLKSALIEDFSTQTESLKGFSESVKGLTEDLKNLNQELANITAGGGIFGAGQSNLEIVSETLARGGTTTNALIEEQRKLNTLIEELKPIFEETRDNTKNVADSVSGRRAIIER